MVGFRTLKIVRLAVIVGGVKASNKKDLKNAEKVRFYKGLTHFQNLKYCQDQLRKIGQKNGVGSHIEHFSVSTAMGKKGNKKEIFR